MSLKTLVKLSQDIVSRYFELLTNLLLISIISGWCERNHFQPDWLQTPLGPTEQADTTQVFNLSTVQVSRLALLNPKYALFRQFEKTYGLFFFEDYSGIKKITGCHKPCSYNEYKFIGDRLPTKFNSDHYVVSLGAISNDITVERENLMNPLTSLVAEFGGFLGLFLGVSFMTIWDGVQKVGFLVRDMKTQTQLSPRKRFQVLSSKLLDIL